MVTSIRLSDDEIKMIERLKEIYRLDTSKMIRKAISFIFNNVTEG